MKVALYARVSTRDKTQDPELQLEPMRQHCREKGWEWHEYVDHASAGDLAHREGWKELLQVTRLGYLDHVLVWKLDRAFRSTVHCCQVLEDFERRGVGFSTLTQPIDTTTAAGRFTTQILAAAAEFERSLIRERVTEGLKNARRRGARLGRPPVTDRPGFRQLWAELEPQVRSGELPMRAAAQRLGCGVATVSRLVTGVPKTQVPKGASKTRPQAA